VSSRWEAVHLNANLCKNAFSCTCLDAWNRVKQTHSLLPGERLIVLLPLLGARTLRLIHLDVLSMCSLMLGASVWIWGRIKAVCNFPADAFDGFLMPYQ
jgi:hypothetical protein